MSAALASAAVVATSIGGLLLFHGRFAASKLEQGPAPAVSGNQGRDVSVLLDYSASFAPYGSGDRDAVDRIGSAIGELATRYWKPPVTLVWSAIGSASVLSPPVCDPVEFSPSLRDWFNATERLEKGIATCVSRAKLLSAQPEGHTDISSAIARAVKRGENSRAAKYIVIFSDLKEDVAPGTHPAEFQLGGTTVLMVHRPGTDETDVPAYLARIRRWAELLKGRGAGRVLDVPLDLVTRNDLVALFNPNARPIGTAATILLDFKDRFQVGNDSAPKDMRYVAALGSAIANQAPYWTPPVTLRMGVLGPSALHMRWIQPIVFEPRLNPVPGRLNNVQDLKIAIEESTRLLLRLAASAAAEADIAGAVALSETGSQLEGLANYLFIVSDFVESRGGVPQVQAKSARGATVVLIWRPSSRDATNEQQFFARIDKWKGLFQGRARSTCAVEMVTLTERSIRDCLGARDGR